MRCAILLFDDVDLMDVAGPYEVLLTASRLEARQGRQRPFEVMTVAARSGPLVAYGGLRLIPEHVIEHAPPVDLLIVPGAIAYERVEEHPEVVDAIKRLAAASDVVTSVCTGAFLLERAGILDGHRATTHWEDVSALAARVQQPVADDVRWVDDGDVITSGGLSSGIAMALHIVERFAGRALAEATARQIDYVWTAHRG